MFGAFAFVCLLLLFSAVRNSYPSSPFVACGAILLTTPKGLPKGLRRCVSLSHYKILCRRLSGSSFDESSITLCFCI